MTYPIYPKHEFACPNVSHCPHLGGASVIAVAHIANRSEETRESLLHNIRVLEDQNRKLLSDCVHLQKELEQSKLELKLERQNKFATNQQKNDDSADSEVGDNSESKKVETKRGAPVGHPGWFRPTPTHYDWSVDVVAPSKCPHCNSKVQKLKGEPTEHLQEDLIEGRYRVVLYRHEQARCPCCDSLVEKPGKGEILGSRIGPGLRSKAIFLRNQIGISYRKVPEILDELFQITLSPAALIGFEKYLAKLAKPIVQDIGKKLASSDGAVHADETYWTLNGQRAYFWVHGDQKYIHFTFDTTRAGEVSRDLLGHNFTGTLVTDCYGGYHAHLAGAKQKCLAHLSRTARDWQKLTKEGSADYQFFADVRTFASRACRFYQRRRKKELSKRKLKSEIAWLRGELERLATTEVEHEKSITLQGRIIRHLSEWLVFIDDPRVEPTNNHAERILRPLVILRKITFGSRTRGGGERMASLMTIAETARRHGHRASDLYYELYTRPPDKVLQGLYAKPA